MKSMYRLATYAVGDLPLCEAQGSFTAAEVWDLVGARSRVATLTLAAGSESQAVYGGTVVAVPLYSPEERAAAPAALHPERLRLQAVERGIARDREQGLKYSGIAIVDITTIQYLPMDRPVVHYESGEKKIPNVIEIPYEHDPFVNGDRLVQSYLVMKNNDGVELTALERAQLIGITLALNDGHIDSRILSHFGFDVEEASNSPEICYYRLTTQESQGKVLSEHERSQLGDLRAIRRIQAITAVVTELKKLRLERIDPTVTRPILEKVLESAIAFNSDILLHGKRQVYWDVATYAHIALRHVKGFQLGKGTTFPYRAKDLKMLIEKVLGCAEDEIKDHFVTKPGKVFFLAGKRSVYFNEDYYSFHIEGSGRLTNFHRLAPRTT